MARSKEPQVLSDIVHIVFPGSPKKYGYRYSALQLKELDRGAIQKGDHVVVKTRDGYQVVEVSSVVTKDKVTQRELEIATAWITDKVSVINWGKRPPSDVPKPLDPQPESDPDLDALMEELI
ncbi:Hypothetical protein MONT_44 [Glutamicibacter phage Montesquieu]|nr:Hypothetical protein MONT_44 [Glutamicibacter phage Montesquieu]